MSNDPNPPAVEPSNLAAPGPHPHEAADFKEWAGQDGTGDKTTGLPEGVKPYEAPAEVEEPGQELV